MKANDKEYKCIEISRGYRLKVIERKLITHRENKLPLFLTPKAFDKHFNTDFRSIMDNNSIWKKVLFVFVLSLFYVVIVPIIFVAVLYDKIFGKKDKIEDELRLKYDLDDSVSEIKLFSEFWNLKGLRDYGVGYLHLEGFTKEQQKECISKWLKILFDIDHNTFEVMYNDLSQKQIEGARNFYKNNPGGHISMASVESILPEEIDKRYGSYR